MGYAAGLIGLTAPMAALAAYVGLKRRSERSRRQARLDAARTPAPATPPPAEEKDAFDAWREGFSSQVEPPGDGKA